MTAIVKTLCAQWPMLSLYQIRPRSQDVCSFILFYEKIGISELKSESDCWPFQKDHNFVSVKFLECKFIRIPIEDPRQQRDSGIKYIKLVERGIYMNDIEKELHHLTLAFKLKNKYQSKKKTRLTNNKRDIYLILLQLTTYDSVSQVLFSL